VLAWGRTGKGEGELDSPIAIAVDRQDRLYVTDFKNLRVQRFSPDGAFLGAIPVPYAQPGGIAVNRDGTRIYVAHWNQNKVAVYSPTGELQGEWGQKGTGDGEFQLPGGMAWAKDGSLLVADQGNSRVQRFTPEGKFLSKWGEHGAALGQFGEGRGMGSRFAGPQFLAVDRDGHVYATEVTSSRVQRFSAEGKPLLAFGNNTEGLGGFAGGHKDIFGPIGVCVDREGHVWVSATNHRVQQFDREGHFRQSLGEDGSAPGQFHYPHALVVDSRNHLYVVDAQNDRIQKFAL
jgi:sugar lactone lactonase YvrE